MPPFSAVRRSRALRFWRTTPAKEVICRCKVASDCAVCSIVDSRCIFNSLTCKTPYLREVAPRAEPRREGARERPRMAGIKTARLFLGAYLWEVG